MERDCETVNRIAKRLGRLGTIMDGMALLPEQAHSRILSCPVRWGRAGSRRFGAAKWTRSFDGMQVIPVRITLNPALIAAPELADICAETFLHEVAHLIAETLFKPTGAHSSEFGELAPRRRRAPTSAGHGPVWQRVMRSMGLDPQRIASREDTARAAAYGAAPTPRKVVGRCARCSATIERVRELPIDRNYTHGGCGGYIAPVKNRAKASRQSRR